MILIPMENCYEIQLRSALFFFKYTVSSIYLVTVRRAMKRVRSKQIVLLSLLSHYYTNYKFLSVRTFVKTKYLFYLILLAFIQIKSKITEHFRIVILRKLNFIVIN